MTITEVIFCFIGGFIMFGLFMKAALMENEKRKPYLFSCMKLYLSGRCVFSHSRNAAGAP